MQRLTRKQGVRLQNMGMAIAIPVLFVHYFVFELQDWFLLLSTGVSVLLIFIGIRTIAWYDEQG